MTKSKRPPDADPAKSRPLELIPLDDLDDGEFTARPPDDEDDVLEEVESEPDE
jgi:hypothetical protein